MDSESRFRNKITWFSFGFSILVVWVHSANGELFLGKSPEARTVIAFQCFLGNTIAQIAVPGFFMMSGYLFYRNFIWEKLGDKWESRIRSVLVPFLLWNFIYYLGYVVGSRLPLVSDIIGKGKIPFGWYPAIDAVLHYSYNYVFWYLYQLILLTLLAPVLYISLKHAVFGGIVLSGIFYIVQKGTTIPYLNLDALFYYSLGAYGGLHGKGLIEKPWSPANALAGAGIWLMAMILLLSPWPEGIGDGVCCRVLGPAGLWLLIDEEKLPAVRESMKYNFFLYAIHFAWVRLINKTAARILGGSWLAAVMLFLSMPAIMVWISSETGSWMKKNMPAAWRLLNGGR